MVNSDFSAFIPVGSAYTRSANTAPRQAVTLEARIDPRSPHEYSVQLASEKVDAVSQAESTEKKSRQNRDPASQAFFSVADYQPVKHSIDIVV
ncbi:MAG TPA: hypothetical protein VN030_02640 [Cellvibrio sp.]|nr:hypothetical protein [Cellvibrio sp.]